VSSAPLVSIVMNCYNSDRFLREAIESIYSQTYSNWEIIFWDNASTDDSASIAKSYDERIKYYQASETTRLGEARNLALSKVSGEYVAFLDCDDLYLADKLEQQIAIMHGSDYAMCYGSALVINENGICIGKNKVTEKHGFLLNKLLLNYEINMQTVMIRMSVINIDRLSFDDSLKFSPDYDLFMRIAINHKVCSISEYLAQYRKSSNSLTKKLIGYIGPEMEITLNKLKNSNSLSSDSYLEFNKAMNMAYFYKALPYISKGDYKSARRFVIKGALARKKIFILYLLLCLPVNRKWLIKLIVG